nr:hypothetical protein [Tanacetum cinerariifolium]
MIRFVQEFFHYKTFPKGCNSSFIALIPKVSNAKIVSDFCLISLIGCQYKIIGKILANRLNKVIRSCISLVQSAFIKGRNILNGSLILNEVLAWYRKSKKDPMVFKVDFEKAFDSLRWNYLDLVLDKLGFGTKWRSWIFGCLRNARSSVLINGSPTAEFELFRVSGLKINIHKSNVFGVGISDDDVTCMANIIGCGEANLPMKYLGVPVGCNMSRCSNWNAIIQKLSYKLSSWKARLLSVGGRLSLIKSVLGNLPTYYMSIYLMPVLVRNKLESMRNKFFIGGDHEDKKMTWVNWKKCMASRKHGGLGIMSIFGNIYGFDGGINTAPNSSSKCSTRGAILYSIYSLKQKGMDLLSLCSRNIGNGASTRFWEDTWCGNQTLKNQFPRVYLLDSDRNHYIASRVPLIDWSTAFRRVPKGDGSNGFSVVSVRELVDSHTLDVDLVATHWNRSIPIKFYVFLWRLKLNRLPSMVNLDWKGIDVGLIL